MDSKRHGGIDLHVHSNASDGTYTPAELIELAARLGLEAISITDHDTLEGSRQALTCELPASLEFITGIEISAQAPPQCAIDDSLHILGYGIDPEYDPLVQALAQLKQARDARTHHIVQRLNQLDVPLAMDAVMAEVGEATPGRPHVARALVKSGAAVDINDAFDRFIGKGGPAFVGKKRLPSKQAIELIQAAGGVPVLAHPYLIKDSDANILERLIGELCHMGLAGIEVYYPSHSAEAVAHYLDLARRFDLLVTGGSDFHGQLIPEIQMGRGHGELYIPYTLFEKLRQHQLQMNSI